MSLRTKSIILLSSIVALLVGALALVYAGSSLRELRRIEDANVQGDLARVQLQLNAERSNLSLLLADWSYWDDSYKYVLDGDQKFAAANLIADSFVPIKVNLIAFATTNGTVRYATWLADGEERPFPTAITTQLKPGGRLANLPPDVGTEVIDRGNVAGIEILDGRIMLVVSRASRSFTDPSAPPAGLVMMGREITADSIASIADLVGRQVDITPCVDGSCGSIDQSAAVRTNSTISRAMVLNDIAGEPAIAITVTADRTIYRDGVANMNQVLLITLAIGLAAILLAARLVSRVIVRRLERVSAAALEAGRTGDHRKRVPEEGTDEIAQLASGINVMLHGLEASNRELEESNRALDAARGELELASAAKSRFLAHVSHEIRNPLNGVLAFAQLLQLDDLEPDQTAAVNHILTAGRHITSLLEEFLDIARIEAGSVPIDLRPVSVRAIALEAIQLSRPLAAQRAITITGGGQDRTVIADPVRLRQVILNLVSNAIDVLCNILESRKGTVDIHVPPLETAEGEDPSVAAERQRRKRTAVAVLQVTRVNRRLHVEIEWGTNPPARIVNLDTGAEYRSTDGDNGMIHACLVIAVPEGGFAAYMAVQQRAGVVSVFEPALTRWFSDQSLAGDFRLHVSGYVPTDFWDDFINNGSVLEFALSKYTVPSDITDHIQIQEATVSNSGKVQVNVKVDGHLRQAARAWINWAREKLSQDSSGGGIMWENVEYTELRAKLEHRGMERTLLVGAEPEGRIAPAFPIEIDEQPDGTILAESFFGAVSGLLDDVLPG